MTKRPIPSRRREIDRHLQTWDEPKLTTDEWVAAVEDWPHDDPYDVAQNVIRQRRRRQPVGDVPSAENGSGLPADFAALVWARSVAFAADADEHPDVQSFRADVLDGKLLPWAQVQQWADEQSELDGPATTYIRLPLPPGYRQGDPVTPRLLDVGVHEAGYDTDSLDYALPGSEWVHCVPVAGHGVLGRLRRLSERLAQLYGWQPAQATVFVLTGATPVVQMMRGSRPVFTTNAPRITLTIDPDVPTELVAAAYKRARAELLGSRARPPSAKGAALVAHAAERPGVEVRGLWRQWNEGHPDERYDTLPAFRQALRDAQRRVLGRPRQPR
jgi:hypothetical protein